MRFLTYKLYHPDHYYRFITKHISEWYFDYDSAPWKQTDIFIKLFNKKVAEGKKAQIKKLIWMKEVPAFNTEKPIWHMHPIVFLDGLKEPDGPLITLEMVLAANLQQDVAQCTRVQPLLDKFTKKYGLTEPKEIAHFLSQVAHESKFKPVEEGLSYKPQNMRKTFGCKGNNNKYNAATDSCTLENSREKLWSQEHFYARNPEHLGNYVYANRMGNGDEASGEGYKYRGRGLIQITGKNEYQNIMNAYNRGKSEKERQNFVDNPDLLINDINCAVESAYIYWFTKPTKSGGLLKDIAKTADVYTVSWIVNGGQNGYPDRLVRYNALAPIMNLPLETK